MLIQLIIKAVLFYKKKPLLYTGALLTTIMPIFLHGTNHPAFQKFLLDHNKLNEHIKPKHPLAYLKYKQSFDKKNQDKNIIKN